MVIPGVYDAFCGTSELEIAEPESSTRTTDMLLFRCRLLCAGCLFNVNSQLLFCLVFVHWPGRVVNFVAVEVKAGTGPPSV